MKHLSITFRHNMKTQEGTVLDAYPSGSFLVIENEDGSEQFHPFDRIGVAVVKPIEEEGVDKTDL